MNKLIAVAVAMALVPHMSRSDEASPGDGRTVHPITTGQTGHIFQHEIVKIGLERLGYEVEEPLEADYPAIHLAIADGQADYTTNHWVPLQQPFFDAAGGADRLQRIGVLISSAGQGYYIDKATADKYEITSLEDFTSSEIAKLFDGDGDGKANLTGCNPGWGCEREIEFQIEAYKLGDVIDVDQGSYFALMADTITRYNDGQPVFFYTWTPQWVTSVLRPGENIVQLNVPFSATTDGADTSRPDGTNPGFVVNDIVVLANKDFIADNPAAKRLFELIKIPLDDVNGAILEQSQGRDSQEEIAAQATEWVQQNGEMFDTWVREASEAE